MFVRMERGYYFCVRPLPGVNGICSGAFVGDVEEVTGRVAFVCVGWDAYDGMGWDGMGWDGMLVATSTPCTLTHTHHIRTFPVNFET